jgi:excisionase family DNA binding protein
VTSRYRQPKGFVELLSLALCVHIPVRTQSCLELKRLAGRWARIQPSTKLCTQPWTKPCGQPSTSPHHPQQRRLLTVADARQELGGIGNTTFYKLVEDGTLSTVKIGRRTFVAASELDDFIKRQSSAAVGVVGPASKR